MSEEVILELEEIVKEFSGVKALKGVNFTVRKGEIHCLVGENGAGKSTLMKIISGVYPTGNYSGKIAYKGKQVHFHNIRDSKECGISIIHQELALSPYLSIEENIFLGHENAKFGVIDWRLTSQAAVQLMNRVGLSENPKKIVNTLGMGQKQLVEIAKSLSHCVELLIFDEPTAALNDLESSKLLELILELKKQGMTCIMISHKLNEVLAVADTITILRDGETVSSQDVRQDPLSEEQIIQGMVGRDLSSRFPDKTSKIGEVSFEVRDWTFYDPDFPDKKLADNVSFHVKSGEILGICGLMGSGRTELMRSLFGKSYGVRHQGKIIYKGKECNYNSPRDAIKDGIIYVSEDRKDLGLILIQRIKFNMSLSSLDKLSKLMVVNEREIILGSEDLRQKLAIKSTSINQAVENLSGGNQQKVVLGRCLMAEPDLLIIDEPTRGVDVGAKYEIYSILNEFVAQGKSAIMISSELPEVIGMSDRLYVMSEGRLVNEVERKDMFQESIMEHAIGGYK